jgi:hypothetical protein
MSYTKSVFILNTVNKKEIRDKIGLIPGHRSGIAFSYLLMLSGDTSTFKPDRHMFNFFGNLLEYGVMDENDLRKAFEEQLKIVKISHPKFTIRTLDSLIWNYMKYEADRSQLNETSKHSLKQRSKPYFMTSSKWYYFDELTYRFYLHEDAPLEAIDSYKRIYSTHKE